MSTAVDELVYPLTQKNSLKECSVRALQQIADEHPYFTAIQLLLTKKMEEEKDEHFLQQKSRATLYFPDPLWLDKLLHEKPSLSNETGVKESKPAVHVFEPEFTARRTVAIDAQAAIDQLNADPVHHEVAGDVAVIAEENKIPHAADIKTDELPGASNGSGEMVKDEEMLTESPANIDALETSSNGYREPDNSANPDEPARPLIKEAVMKTTETGNEILFEPFHTVDYFASQGIKFTEEEKPVDKLGQQLKSFTEWLKILRKSPDKDINIPINPQTEQKVEKLAAHSLADREVVTEAMAEVWEKQGNKEKAKAIYDKLSLLNPSKRSYFAAKIEHLKNT